VVILLVQVASAYLFDVFKAQVDRKDSPLPAMTFQERVHMPADIRRIPPPVLQEDEAMDFQRVREQEDRRLKSYGWVDAKSGVVHIPIGEAMRLLADRKTAEAHNIRVKLDSPKGGQR
jgi:hypothetical protein